MSWKKIRSDGLIWFLVNGHIFLSSSQNVKPIYMKNTIVNYIFVNRLLVVLYYPLVSKGNKMELRCSLECKYLNSDDYKDLLWTTLSEFPGRCDRQ